MGKKVFVVLRLGEFAGTLELTICRIAPVRHLLSAETFKEIPMRRADLFSIALAMTTAATAFAPIAVTAAPRLTCTFIQKQCFTECGKKVGPGFCKVHCDGEKKNCVSTGKWNSFGREFTNVIRR